VVTEIDILHVLNCLGAQSSFNTNVKLTKSHFPKLNSLNCYKYSWVISFTTKFQINNKRKTFSSLVPVWYFIECFEGLVIVGRLSSFRLIHMTRLGVGGDGVTTQYLEILSCSALLFFQLLSSITYLAVTLHFLDEFHTQNYWLVRSREYYISKKRTAQQKISDISHRRQLKAAIHLLWCNTYLLPIPVHWKTHYIGLIVSWEPRSPRRFTKNLHDS